MRYALVLGAFAVACSATEAPAPPPLATTPPSAASDEPDGQRPAAPSAVAPKVAPEPTAPATNAATAAAHTAVQQTLNGGPLLEHPLVHFTPIEDPSGGALQAFHASLRELQAHEEDAATPYKVRIAFYGASSVAADRYPAYLRGYLQQRFGDAGVGFLALVPLWRWHRHDAVRVTASKHWRIEHGQRKTGKLDGHYGLLGASAHADNKRAWSQVAARSGAVSALTDSDTLDLHTLNQPSGGSFTLRLGGKSGGKKASKSGSEATYTTRGDAMSPVVTSIDLPEVFTPLRIEAKGDGEVRLFGASFERDRSGVVVDALGIGGTRSANLLQWNEEPWAAALQARAPSLYILAYGANESVDDDEPIAQYRADLEAVLDRFARAAPDASCVLVGPVDYPMKNEDAEDEGAQLWGPRPRVREIIDIQREVAAARGCGFFDTSKLTGGLGSMDGWVTADPQLAKGDHLHLSPLGYLHFGRVLSDALMADFDGEPRAPSAP